MKKLSAILIAMIMVAATAVTAFAAGINEHEQAVLDELRTSVTMADGEMVIPEEYVNQAENYYNTIDMTAEESKAIIAILEEGEAFMEKSGAENIKDLTFAQKKELLAYGERVVGVIGMTMSYDKPSKVLTIYAPNGDVAFSAVPYLTKKGQIADNGVITVLKINTKAIKRTLIFLAKDDLLIIRILLFDMENYMQTDLHKL
jgi:hypothetical protein